MSDNLISKRHGTQQEWLVPPKGPMETARFGDVKDLVAEGVADMNAKLSGIVTLDEHAAALAEKAALCHAANHFAGDADALSPESIGAVRIDDPRLGDSRIPTAHAMTHAANGEDVISPDAIGAARVDDIRLTNARHPINHAANHRIDGVDMITPGDIGAVRADDSRLTNARPPLAHAANHGLLGSDPPFSPRHWRNVPTSG